MIGDIFEIIGEFFDNLYEAGTLWIVLGIIIIIAIYIFFF